MLLTSVSAAFGQVYLRRSYRNHHCDHTVLLPLTKAFPQMVV